MSATPSATPVATPPVEVVIEGTPRLRVGHSLRELEAAAGMIAAFAERDVRVRYKQSVLGVLWALLQPLAFLAIFVLALGRFVKVPGGGAPYAAFALSALVPWTYVQNAVSTGAGALVSDAPLVRKVFFPREVPVLGALLSSGLDLAIGLAMFAVVGPLLGARVSLVWLLVPVLALVLVELAAGVALALAALNTHYRDVRYALPLALQLWLFASPVAYPLTVVPARWRGLYAAVNPAAGVLDGFRRVLALGEAPALGLLAISVVSSTVLLAAGYLFFKRLEPRFADVL